MEEEDVWQEWGRSSEGQVRASIGDDSVVRLVGGEKLKYAAW